MYITQIYTKLSAKSNSLSLYPLNWLKVTSKLFSKTNFQLMNYVKLALYPFKSLWSVHLKETKLCYKPFFQLTFIYNQLTNLYGFSLSLLQNQPHSLGSNSIKQFCLGHLICEFHHPYKWCSERPFINIRDHSFEQENQWFCRFL